MLAIRLAVLLLTLAATPLHAACIQIGKDCAEPTATELKLRLDDETPTLDIVRQFPDLTRLSVSARLRFKAAVDLAPLAELQGLQSLQLHDLNLTGLDPLTKLPALTHLSLWGSTMPDLDAVGALSGLRSLNLHGIDDLHSLPAGLSHLAKLERLDVMETKLSDISALAAIPGLTHVLLSNSRVSDLSPLAGKPVEKLWITNCPVESLTPLAGNTTLTELLAGGTRIITLDGLEGAAGLEMLIATGSSLRDLSALFGKTVLRELEIHDTSVADLSPLAGASSLRKLGFNGTQVEDISVLAGLTRLNDLKFKQTRVNDIAPLGGLTNLAKLTLPQNPMDLSHLSGLHQVHVLRAPDLPEIDLSPVLDLPALRIFYPGTARIPIGKREEIEAFIKARN